MSDQPSQTPDPKAPLPDYETASDRPPASPDTGPDHSPPDETSLSQRTEDEAAALGDFA
ncbi:hypothetical protein [Sphingomonas fuzhouensis]|uniref:hypothetical protein n=1 Tax=Sphingomonas fuzhouensis TaxID=3106033 RepID=UPI002B00186D|nr:hypothetical protein [Sphingomonas sp. SGZ-02]